jgi:hypothetical protein
LIQSTPPAHRVSPWRRPIVPAALVTLVYVAVHVPSLAPSLEDFDSINFGLALHQYDPTNNQPHPPGYPVYVAAGRASLALVHLLVPGADSIRADALALALLSLVGAAIAILGAWRLFDLLTTRGSRVPLYATLLLASSPLFWITGLRPLSDMPGLAIALVSQALLLRSFAWQRGQDQPEGHGNRGALVWGAFIMGLGIGVRSQVLWLTLPWLLVALIANRRSGLVWLVRAPGAALVAGGLLWAIPMVIAVGGPARYLRALGAQANGDFSFIDMFWRDPTARHLARALRETFEFPWETRRLAVVVALLALLGGGWLALRRRRALLLVAAGFLPYAVFHLLFHETVTIRYALPLLVPVAYLAACGIEALPKIGAPIVAVACIMWALFSGGPSAHAYGAAAHPAFRAIRDMLATQSREAPAQVFAHHAVGRALRVAAAAPLPVVEPPERYEWLGPVDYWKRGGAAPVWFLADPRRSDLMLIDPQSLHDVTHYRWAVGQRHVVGGTRPVDADWYRLAAPGWFAGTGWSLSLEAGGVTQASHAGLDRGPIEAYVRRRTGPTWLMIGGRDLAAPASAPSALALTIDGRTVDSWDVDPAVSPNFLRVVALSGGVAPEGAGAYATLQVSARALTPGAPTPPVAIRQFDVQTAPTLMYGFGAGWHEEEVDAQAGTRWRWTSDRSILQVVPPQAVEVRLRGESPRKYFDTAPRVRLLAGEREIAVLRPEADFDWRVKVPADAITDAHGALTIETDRVYLPGKVEGTSDQRRLGLRLFDIEVHPVSD